MWITLFSLTCYKNELNLKKKCNFYILFKSISFKFNNLKIKNIYIE